LTESEARFTINVREGRVELEGKESFVDKHLEKFEELFKLAIKEAMGTAFEQHVPLLSEAQMQLPPTAPLSNPTPLAESKSISQKRTQKISIAIPPIAVDLKSSESKPGLREFYAEKKPTNHYEKTAVFAYYLTKFNKHSEIKFGEILTCYEEISEKKPSVVDIVKNSVRYKGWLENGSEKFSCRLTISGENFVKFDLPAQKTNQLVQETIV
jgi:hypothetical protein